MVKNTLHFRLLLNFMFGSPLFGVYLLGILSPHCTPTAALIALIVGVSTGFGLCVDYQYNYVGVTPVGTSVSDCVVYFCRRWPGVSGCSSNISFINESAVNSTIQKLIRFPKSWSLDWNFKFLQHFSYHMGGILTLAVTLIVGVLVSRCTKANRSRSEIDSYLASFLQTSKQNVSPALPILSDLVLSDKLSDQLNQFTFQPIQSTKCEMKNESKQKLERTLKL